MKLYIQFLGPAGVSDPLTPPHTSTSPFLQTQSSWKAYTAQQLCLRKCKKAVSSADGFANVDV